MAIIYNGTNITSNGHNIVYNGTNVREVWVCDTSNATCTKVWGKSAVVTFNWDYSTRTCTCAIPVSINNTICCGLSVDDTGAVDNVFWPEGWTHPSSYEPSCPIYDEDDVTIIDYSPQYNYMPVINYIECSYIECGWPLQITTTATQDIRYTTSGQMGRFNVCVPRVRSFTSLHCGCVENIGWDSSNCNSCVSLANTTFSCCTTPGTSTICVYPFKGTFHRSIDGVCGLFSEGPYVIDLNTRELHKIDGISFWRNGLAEDEDISWSNYYPITRCSGIYLIDNETYPTYVDVTVCGCTVRLNGVSGSCTVTVNL